MQYQTNSVLGYNIASYISSTINIKENNIHYFKFPHIKKENSDIYFSIINLKFEVNSEMVTCQEISKKNIAKTSDRKIVNCFLTEKKLIMCFYYSKENNKHAITLLYTDFRKVIESDKFLDSNENDDVLFAKGIHFKNEIQIFFYYFSKNQNLGKIKIVEVREINSQYSLIDYMEEIIISLSGIILKSNFRYNILELNIKEIKK